MSDLSSNENTSKISTFNCVLYLRRGRGGVENRQNIEMQKDTLLFNCVCVRASLPLRELLCMHIACQCYYMYF